MEISIKNKNFLFRVCALLLYFLFLAPHFASAAVLQKPANNLGLVGYWNFNEGRGTVATDNSVSKNVGTLTGGPLWVSGKFGTGVQFNSSGSVGMANAPAVNANGSFTYSVWIYPRSYTNGLASDGVGTYFVDRQGVTVPLSSIKTVGDKFCYQTRYDNSTGLGCTSSTTNIPLNTWTHIVAVRDYNSNFYLYFNGVQQGITADAGSLALTPDAPKLGAHQGGGGNVDGRIDDLRIYTRALSPSEVSALYKTKAAITNAPQNNRLTSGLVGMWSMNGRDTNWATNKTNDLSGNGNHGEMVNMSTSTSSIIGKIGQGLIFDGADDYIEVKDSATLEPALDLTIAAWVYPTAAGSFPGIVVKSGVFDEATAKYAFYFGGASRQLAFAMGGTLRASTLIVPLNEWSFVAISQNSGGLTFYLNGVSEAVAVTSAPSYSTETVNIGAFANSGRFPGKIDEVRIYNRGLTQSEVKQLYLMGAANVNHTQNNRSTNGLVGMWSMNGRDTNWATNKTNDTSGGGYHGTMTNMSTSTSPTMGKVGQAFNFDGIDDYVTGPVSALGTPVTLCSWYKISATSDIFDNGAFFDATLTIRSSAANYEAWSIGMSNTAAAEAKVFAGALDDADGVLSTAVGTTNLWGAAGTWQHICGVFISSTSRDVYLNGVFEGSNAASENVQASNLLIGVGSNSTGFMHYSKGAIDEARVYNRALSPSEIKQLYLMGK